MEAKPPPNLDEPVTRREFLEVTNNLRTELKDDFRALAVVVERIDGNVRALAEAMLTTRDGLERRMDELERRLSERISILESVVRENSRDIRKNSEDLRKNSEDIRKNSEDIAALSAEVSALRHDFDHREDRKKLAELDERVTQTEKRLGVR